MLNNERINSVIDQKQILFLNDIKFIKIKHYLT